MVERLGDAALEPPYCTSGGFPCGDSQRGWYENPINYGMQAVSTANEYSAYGCRIYDIAVGSLAQTDVVAILRDYQCKQQVGPSEPVRLKGCAPLEADPVECPSHQCVYANTTTLVQCNYEIPNPGGAPNLRTDQVGVSFCTKVQWDSAHALPCCLGLFDSGASQTATHSGTGVPYTAQQLCDPRWCLGDPAGVCGSVIAKTCSATFTDREGAVRPLLVQKGHPCNQYYENVIGAVDSGADSGRGFPALDAIVERFCQQYPKSPSCACFLGQTADCAPNCKPYVSLSDSSAYVQVVGPADGSRDPPFPLSIADAVCLNTACRDPMALQTWDTLKTQDTCPQDICFQVLEGLSISIGVASASGIFVNDSDLVCKVDPTISKGKALPVVGRGVYVWPIGIDTAGQPAGSPIEVEVYNKALPGADPFEYLVQVDGAWPAGLGFAPRSGTAPADGATEPSYVQVLIDNTQFDPKTPPQDLKLQFVPTDTSTGSAVETTIRLVPFQTGLPPQPPCGQVPCPDPGKEGRVIKVYKPPPWYRWALLGAIAFLVFGLIVAVVGAAVARKRVRAAQARLRALEPRITDATR